MFKAIQETDKYDDLQIKFILTQGDTAVIWSTPTHDGELVDFELIEKCLLKFSTRENNAEIFVKEGIQEDGHYSIRLESEESAELPLATLIYEIEYTFKDGTVNTPNRYYWQITDQII